MLQKISIIIFFLLISSMAFANDNYIMFTYGSGHDSMFRNQQKEEQKIYGVEYGHKLKEYWWLSFEAALSSHEYTKVNNSFLVKCWSIYKLDMGKINLYGGFGAGLSSYKDDKLVKRCPSASLGFKAGLEYEITNKISISGEYLFEHNSGIWIDDRGRNIDFYRVGIKYYF